MDSLTTGLSGSQKDELMETVKQQIAIANAQELLTVGKILKFVPLLFKILCDVCVISINVLIDILYISNGVYFKLSFGKLCISSVWDDGHLF